MFISLAHAQDIDGTHNLTSVTPWIILFVVVGIGIYVIRERKRSHKDSDNSDNSA